MWHDLSINQVLDKLEASKSGLVSKEVDKRLEKFGPNVLAKEAKPRAWLFLLSQFKSALVYVLLVAGAISLLFKEFIDAYVIFAAVLINVIVGFVQEYKANQSLEKLNKIVKQESLVLRDGVEQKIESKYLVPGDIIVLSAGDRVSADARLLSVSSLGVNEAPLTGESWPIQKTIEPLGVGTVLAERTNMVFAGTLAVEGRAQAVVVDTGLNTEIGKITVLLKETADDKTPLQEKLDGFAKNITKVIVIIALFIFILGVFSGHELIQMFSVSVAIAVSAIPEGLLISLTMILTVGMQRILRHQGLVRRLVSAETLGSTTVICTDKTGTLTEGEMRVNKIVTPSHQMDLVSESFREIEFDSELKYLSRIALLCNDSIVQNPHEVKDLWQILGTPTERALFIFGAQNLNTRENFAKFSRVDEIPFDSSRKYMITRHRFDKTHDIIFVKGAPEKILSFSKNYWQHGEVLNLTDKKMDFWQAEWQVLSSQGLRVLAGGFKIVPSDFKDIEHCQDDLCEFVLVGIWGISDPLRVETKNTLKATLQAGINTVIITGDNKFTASAIAHDLGLDFSENSVMSGSELLGLTDDQLTERVKDIKVYARVTPADKLRIIKAWQRRGEVVSMTGDGVNDAPALKAADVGVALNSGSDVAKETADLVLLDNNFATIVMAIKQGRVIFANIRKVLLYLLSDAFSEIIIIVLSILFGLPLPIITAQILWRNLINDGLPALALTMEPEEEEIMNTKVKDQNKLLDFENKFFIFIISLVTGLAALGMFYFFYRATGNLDLARTVTFTILCVYSLLYIFAIKNLQHTIWHRHTLQNRYLNGAVVIGFILQLLAIYVPFFQKALHTVALDSFAWLVILGVVLGTIALIEVIKVIFKYKLTIK